MKGRLLLAFLLLFYGTGYAHVILDSPVGGESFDMDEVVVIKWHLNVAHPQDNWDLYLSTDSGITWQELAIDLPVDQMTFTWIVPDLETSHARIKIVMDNIGPSYESESEDFFIGIYNPLILNFPKGNENFSSGSSQELDWEVNGFVSFDFWNLHFSEDGGESWMVIENNIPMERLSQEWLVPEIITSKARIRLEMNIAGVLYQDLSGVFTISEQVVTALAPNDLSEKSIEAYPNPFSESVSFKINSPGTSELGLIIYDQTGRSVFNKNFDAVSLPSKNIVWSPKNIKSGIYYFQLHSIDGIESGKLVYQK